MFPCDLKALQPVHSVNSGEGIIRILEFHCALTLPDSGKQAEKSEKTAQKAGERNDLRNAGALPEKSGEEPGTPDSENILSKE